MHSSRILENSRPCLQRYCFLSFQVSLSFLLLVLIYFLDREGVLRTAGSPLLLFGYALALCLSVFHDRVCLREFRKRCYFYLPLPLSVLTAYNAAFFSMQEGLQRFSYCAVFLLFLARLPSFLCVWRSGADKFQCALTFFAVPILDFLKTGTILIEYEIALRIPVS